MRSNFKVTLLVFMVVLMVSSQVTYAQDVGAINKMEFEKIVLDAESKGVEFDIQVENIDYENLDIEKIRRDVESLTLIPKKIYMELDEVDEVDEVDELKNEMSLRSYDEYVKSLYAVYKYKGHHDIYGRGYNYDTLIHVDYDCLFDHNDRPVRIERINDAFATGINFTIGVNFSQTGRIIESRVSDSKIDLRGKGRYTIGIEGIGGAMYDVEYYCTVVAGHKGNKY